MSPSEDHAAESTHTAPEIDLVIRARPRDLGGFSVRRSLPAPVRRLVGPFIFFDHMGPALFPVGSGIDVRPHPHIGLATVTYLFEGEILHRDSLGTVQAIRPGDVNWMIAGRGIVHSERSAPERRKAEQSLHGIQAWVALPQASEQTEPAFFHHPSASLPELSLPGITLRLIAGDGFGLHSPVETASPTLYADVQLTAAAELALPTDHVERAFYVVSGQVACAGDVFGSGDLVILRPGAAVSLRAEAGARVMVLGGAPIDGERHIFWNFVSSSSERLERAKQDWKARRFPLVPGDEVEFTPLPPG